MNQLRIDFTKRMKNLIERILRRFGYAKITEHIVIKEQYFDIERCLVKRVLTKEDAEYSYTSFALKNLPYDPKKWVLKAVAGDILEHISKRMNYQLTQNDHGDIVCMAEFYVAKKKP